MTENDGEIYGGYSVDDEDQPQGDGDSMSGDRGLAEPLDEGYSPPEKWSVGQGYGNTPLEEELGESLDQRIAQEEPEQDPYAEAERDRFRGVRRSSTTVRSATSAPDGWSPPTRARARTRTPSPGPETSASTARARGPRRPPCTLSTATVRSSGPSWSPLDGSGR